MCGIYAGQTLEWRKGGGGAGRSAKKKEVTNGGWTSLGVDTSAFFFVT